MLPVLEPAGLRQHLVQRGHTDRLVRLSLAVSIHLSWELGRPPSGVGLEPRFVIQTLYSRYCAGNTRLRTRRRHRAAFLGQLQCSFRPPLPCTGLLLRRYRTVCDSFDLIRYRRVVGRCLVLEQL